MFSIYFATYRTWQQAVVSSVCVCVCVCECVSVWGGGMSECKYVFVK